MVEELVWEREVKVEEMNDSKQKERGLVSPGSGFFSNTKQELTEVKKTALRDLNDNIIMPPQNGVNRNHAVDEFKVSGTKRSIPESSMAPPSRQFPCSNGANGNLVYIRRKSENEVEKSNTIDRMDNDASFPQVKESSHGIQEAFRQQSPLEGPKGYSAFAPIPGASINTYSVGGPSLAISLGRAGNEMPSTDVNHNAISSENIHVNSQKKREQDLKERFHRLQALLKSYDNASHEDYIQKLRALPSVGRSRHAVELEKRAIHLLLEEKKELGRMKVLNVLGKSTSKDNVSPSVTQATSGK